MLVFLNPAFIAKHPAVVEAFKTLAVLVEMGWVETAYDFKQFVDNSFHR